jgi:hypothetical protein
VTKKKKRKQIRDEREAEKLRQLKIACDHWFGPEGDMTPTQIARLRGSQEPESSMDFYWGGIGPGRGLG